MLLGGSKVLQDSIRPGNVSARHLQQLNLIFSSTDSVVKVASSSPPECANLPSRFLPILVDRIVEFIYTGTYTTERDLEPMLIRHATTFPEGMKPTSYHQPNLDGAKFHMHLCGLAEELEFSSLYQHAHKKIAYLITIPYVQSLYLANLLDAAFAPQDS